MSENVNAESNKEICPYCQKEIEDKFFDDHMMCHELENEEKSNNSINQQRNNDNNNRNNGNNNANNNASNTGNILSTIFDIFNPTSQRNISINNNNQNSQNYSSSSSNTNNNQSSNGFFADLLKLAITNNNTNNNRNNSNNNFIQEGFSQIGNMFSTISRTVSDISHITSQLNELGNQINSHENNNNAPPPAPINNSNNSNNNNNPFPQNLIFPSTFQNIQIMPPIIIGQGGQILNPFNRVNIDAIMNLLPSSIITEKKEGESNNCIICLSDFEIGDKVTSLPCLHVFHTDCIKNWLQSKNHCPICKYTITEESLRRGS